MLFRSACFMRCRLLRNTSNTTTATNSKPRTTPRTIKPMVFPEVLSFALLGGVLLDGDRLCVEVAVELWEVNQAAV